MKTKLFRGLVALALPVAAIAVAGSAMAGVAGFAGTARLNADRDCFVESSGSALNTCSTNRGINYSVVVGESGGHTARINTSATAVTTLNTCRLLAISPSGSVTTGATATWQVGNGKAINLSSVSVPSYGSMWATCVVPTSGRIHSVSFEN